MFSAGTNKSDNNSSGYTDFMINAALGKYNEVKEFCDRNSVEKVNEIRGWNKVTALMLAVQSNHLEIVRCILSKTENKGINDQNNLKNTALIIAAEKGYLELVQELMKRNADVSLKNEYGQTAAILATENDHVDIVKWICDSKEHENQLFERNKYDKSPILVAAEFGKVKTAEYIIGKVKTEIYAKTFRGISVLHFAATGKSEGHSRIVEIVLKAAAEFSSNADNTLIRAKLDPKKYSITENVWDVKTGFDDTPLIWSAISGKCDHVKWILQHESDWLGNRDRGDYKTENKSIPSLNKQNNQGYSALMKAAEQGHDDIVKFLLENGADTNLKTRKDKFDARKLAWLHVHVSVANIFFEMDLKNGAKTQKISDIFSGPEELNHLGIIFGNHDNSDALKKIVELATNHDFYLELFLSLIPKIEGLSPSLEVIKMLPGFYKSLFKRTLSLDFDLVHRLIGLATVLPDVVLNHPLEKLALDKCYNVVMKMIVECVSSDCMDKANGMQNIFRYSAMGSKYRDGHKVNYKVALVNNAQTFRGGLLEDCIRARIKSIFCTGRIGAFVDKIFWGSLREEPETSEILSPLFCFTNILIRRNQDKHKLVKSFAEGFSRESKNIRLLQSNHIYGRYRAAFMFFSEALSKLFIFILISLISSNYSGGYDVDETYNSFAKEEHLLIIMCFCIMLYEYGQICDNGYNIVPDWADVVTHFKDVWNVFDFVTLGLVGVWAAMRYSASDRVEVGRACLSVSAISSSLGLLQFLSINESVGKLVIMLMAMGAELSGFAVILVVTIIGFAIALNGICSQTYSFSGVSQSFLTFFSAFYGNYDGSFTATFDNTAFPELGITIELVYTLLSGVVLINLVIARMSSTYNDINDKSFQEFQFVRAVDTKLYALVEERSPFCQLPAPFNLIPTIFAPFHFAHLYMTKANHVDVEEIKYFSKGPRPLSISGTMSDVFLGFIMCFIAPWMELIAYLYRIAFRRRHHSKMTYFFEALLIVLSFPIVYPLYVFSLLMKLFQRKATRLSLETDRYGKVRPFVEFEREECSVVTPKEIEETPDRITIKLLRIEKLTNCSENANPIVKFRVGRMEAVSGSSLYGGPNPQYDGKEVVIPLKKDLVIRDCNFSLEVCNKDKLNGTEVFITRYRPKSQIEFRKWIGDGRYEGFLELEDKSKLFLSIKIYYPSFISGYSGVEKEKKMKPVSFGMNAITMNKVVPIHSWSESDAGVPTSAWTRNSCSVDDDRSLMEESNLDEEKDLEINHFFKDEDKRRIFELAINGKDMDEFLAQLHLSR